MNRSLYAGFLIIKRNAGHSKWQNIRHTKAIKDSQRSVLFLKLCQRIKVAIQENGNNINPASNLQLAQAIEVAKLKDMPITSIESCIKSTQVNKEEVQPYRFSIKGPRGSVLLVTALSKSMKKTKQELCYYLKKVGGVMADQSLEGNFEKKGIIITLPPNNMENVSETSIDHAIVAGAEEVSPQDEDERLTFYCEMRQLHNVRSKLQELGYTIEESNISFIPKFTVPLGEDEMELMSKIIGKLEEHPEVVEINDNIQ